jgi:hypothetical protein
MSAHPPSVTIRQIEFELEKAERGLVEQIAAVGDFMVALATYKAAILRWPKDKITLRNRARLIEKNWQD